MEYFVYLLECKDGTIYTGITNDLERRFEMHQKGIGGHYTRSRGVKKILYTEKHPTKSAALKREVEIKNWHRKKKLALIKK